MRAVVIAMLVAAPSIARADVVDPCPPGFDPSHSGCRFDPEVEDLAPLACCCAAIAVLAGAGIAIGWAARRAGSGSREP